MGMGDEILVVKKEALFKEVSFEGFIPIDKKDFLKIILENAEYQARTNELENNSDWQQPIPYVWLVNLKTKTTFLYKRDTTGNEGRLYDKYSGGVGGHIDKKELIEGNGNPITQAMMRELREEVIMKNYPTPQIIGFLNLNHDVHAVHFGIVAIGETEEDVKPAEDMSHGKFYSIEEINSLFSNPGNNVEEWTRVSWPFVKEYLSKL